MDKMELNYKTSKELVINRYNYCTGTEGIYTMLKTPGC